MKHKTFLNRGTLAAGAPGRNEAALEIDPSYGVV